MSFDNDPFEDIVNQFFGGQRTSKRKYKSKAQESEEDNTYIIEEEDYIYIIIELPGYTKDEIKVSINEGILNISANAKKKIGLQDYLLRKLEQGELIQKSIPDEANPKKFNYTYVNGIVEVTLNKR